MDHFLPSECNWTVFKPSSWVISSWVFSAEVNNFPYAHHASLHSAVLIYECCPLALTQLKGFVSWAAAFKDANQHYLPEQKIWVKTFTLSLTEVSTTERFPQGRPRLHLSLKHVFTRRLWKHSVCTHPDTSFRRRNNCLRLLYEIFTPFSPHFVLLMVGIRFYRPCWQHCPEILIISAPLSGKCSTFSPRKD